MLIGFREESFERQQMPYVRGREGFINETPEEDKRKEPRMQEKGRKTK